MRRPEPVFECEYANDRRKHRHRCFHCNKILQPGDRVLMATVTRGTRAAHAEHADAIHSGDMTVKQAMHQWGLEGLKSRGWRVPELDTHY
jgi:hypothetical protein